MPKEVSLHKKIKVSRKRADELLMFHGLAKTLKESQALIMTGNVLINDKRVEKSGEKYPENLPIRIKGRKKFVSRGGDKLEGAIKDFALEKSFQNAVALDIGSSTGGFSHCLLEYGASRVIALDVGDNQLSWTLRQNAKIVSIENTDIRDFNADQHPEIEWIVADISFISLSELAAAIVKPGGAKCKFLLMVKPQFELPLEKIPKGGVVKEAEDRNTAISSAISAFESQGLKFISQSHSKVHGKTGNQETFLYFEKG